MGVRVNQPRPSVRPVDLDPRWEWVEVTRFGEVGARYIKGRCNHLDVVPVESVVDGALLAQLCLTCDAQLPAPPSVNLGGMTTAQACAGVRQAAAAIRDSAWSVHDFERA